MAIQKYYWQRLLPLVLCHGYHILEVIMHWSLSLDCSLRSSWRQQTGDNASLRHCRRCHILGSPHMLMVCPWNWLNVNSYICTHEWKIRYVQCRFIVFIFSLSHSLVISPWELIWWLLMVNSLIGVSFHWPYIHMLSMLAFFYYSSVEDECPCTNLVLTDH